MDTTFGDTRDRRRAFGLDSDVENWIQMLRDLPDLRLDKVEATREALRRNAYDREDVIEHTIDELSNDIGVLCRHESN